MSYILEALRRADSERDRGGVPGIHARPLPAELSEAPRAGVLAHPLAWLTALLAVLLAAVFGWQWLREEPPALPATTSAAPPPVPAAPPATLPAPTPVPAATAALNGPPAAAPATAAATHAPTLESAEATRSAPVVVPPAARELIAAEEAASRQRAARAAAAASAATTAATAPASAAKREPAAVAAAPAPAANPGTAAARGAASASPQPAPAPAEPAIATLRELPEDVRRAIPALAIGGSVYSANPAGRFVVINGQIVHEGDRLGPDLALEQIRLKSAVLRYKNYRFEIDY